MRSFRSGEQQRAVAVIRRKAQCVIRLLVLGFRCVMSGKRRVRQQVLRRRVGTAAREIATVRQSAVLRVDLGAVVVQQVVVVLVAAHKTRARLSRHLPSSLVRKRTAGQALFLPVPEDHEKYGRRQEEAHCDEHADDDRQVRLLRVPVVCCRFCRHAKISLVFFTTAIQQLAAPVRALFIEFNDSDLFSALLSVTLHQTLGNSAALWRSSAVSSRYFFFPERL